MSLFTNPVVSISETSITPAITSNALITTSGGNASLTQSGNTITVAFGTAGSLVWNTKVNTLWNAPTTLGAPTDITGLTSFSVTAGYHYHVFGSLFVTSTSATPDIRFGIQANTTTLTNICFTFTSDFTTNINTATLQAEAGTAFTTDTLNIPTGSTAIVRIAGSFKATVANGSVDFQAGQLASFAGTQPQIEVGGHISMFAWDPNVTQIADDFALDYA